MITKRGRHNKRGRLTKLGSQCRIGKKRADRTGQLRHRKTRQRSISMNKIQHKVYKFLDEEVAHQLRWSYKFLRYKVLYKILNKFLKFCTYVEQDVYYTYRDLIHNVQLSVLTLMSKGEIVGLRLVLIIKCQHT